jgi:hypothetical protein
MRTERVDETFLIKYLLGDLSEEELANVEDRAFSDPAYLGAVKAAETDLIDAYVRGELSAAERARFEGRFLNSPQRRSKLEFARALSRIPPATETPAKDIREAGGGTFWQALAASIFGRGAAFQYAAGNVAILAVAGVSWLAVENGKIRSQLKALEAQSRGLALREEALRGQLTQEENRNQSLSQQLQNKPTGGGALSPAIASLLFVPGLSRAQGGMPNLLLSPSSQLAHIDIQLDPKDNYSRFRVELHGRGGETILTRSNLTRSKTGSAYLVSLDLPATILQAGEHELALQGMDGDNPQPIGFYYFTVQRK